VSLQKVEREVLQASWECNAYLVATVPLGKHKPFFKKAVIYSETLTLQKSRQTLTRLKLTLLFADSDDWIQTNESNH